MVQFSTAKLQNTYYALPNSEMKIMSNVWCSFLIAIKYQISFDQNYKWRKVANVFFFFFSYNLYYYCWGSIFAKVHYIRLIGMCSTKIFRWEELHKYENWIVLVTSSSNILTCLEFEKWVWFTFIEMNIIYLIHVYLEFIFFQIKQNEY